MSTFYQFQLYIQHSYNQTIKMQQEIFSLKWKTFNVHLASGLDDLFTEINFSDVTLVSDDQTQFQAHKFVLSACSPVLKNLLVNNPHSHPLIYLSGVKQQELQSILQFMYLGDARIYQDRIDKFLDIAKDLQVKGLIQECVTGNQFFNREDEPVNNEDDAQYDTNNTRSISDTIDEILDLDILAIITCSDEIGSGKQLYKCQECESVFKSKEGLRVHNRSTHEGMIYICNQCEYRATQQGNLKNHQQSKHEGVKYPCNQCEYQATTQGNLKNHQLSKHEGVKYSCNQCDYQATTQAALKNPQQSKHKGVKYFCNQCEYQAARQSHLKRHQQYKHEGVKYSCNQCEYQTGWKHSLSKHKQEKHSLL
jgi:hypothetical protein